MRPGSLRARAGGHSPNVKKNTHSFPANLNFNFKTYCHKKTNIFKRVALAPGMTEKMQQKGENVGLEPDL